MSSELNSTSAQKFSGGVYAVLEAPPRHRASDQGARQDDLQIGKAHATEGTPPTSQNVIALLRSGRYLITDSGS